ncbi:MAG TPA: hypothetical protein O0X73_01045 [Methanocorpusculum sp.]|nr:hypothetical protein [Methanocorpusculum sp.]
MHYALVSDLLTKEEFDARIAIKCEELGDAIDETCAAMLVVEELGRSHIKIGDIKNTSTNLVSFFGKIIEITPPQTFKRSGDRINQKSGLVASILLGDPTGTVKMILWDTMAATVSELGVGSVIEVIAKLRHGSRHEVICAAFRPSQVTIVETKKPPKSEIMKHSLVAKILFIGHIREFLRRDGSKYEFQEILVGDMSGTTRVITWEPEVFADLHEGISVSFSGLTRKEDGDYVEYVADGRVEIIPHTEPIEVLTCDARNVTEGQTSVVTGVVRSVSPIRTVTTRRGTESRVKNIKLDSEIGEGYVNIACWNEASNAAIFVGDRIEVINAPAKLNKYGEIELSVGRGSILREREEVGIYTEVEGFVVPRLEGMTIDDGIQAIFLITNFSLVPATRIRVSGFCKNARLYAENVEVIPVMVTDLLTRLRNL